MASQLFINIAMNNWLYSQIYNIHTWQYIGDFDHMMMVASSDYNGVVLARSDCEVY